MTEMPQKECAECRQLLPLTAYNGKQRTCVRCVQAKRQRTMERKDAVAFSDALAEKIVDMLAAGMTLTEVCQSAGSPTPRQLRAWRRANPSFDAACDEALAQSAGAHLDKAKEVLRLVEAAKIPASDGKLLFDGHMKLAATLNPSRFGNNATIDVSSAGRPLVDFGAAIAALLSALPARAALPAPDKAIDVEATSVPPADGRTLQ
jgi:hypothetical protein